MHADDDTRHDLPTRSELGISRRKLLAGLGVGAAAGAVPTLLRAPRADGAVPPSGAAPAAAAATAKPLNGDGILVLCTLYGGNDGIDMVVPIGDPAYAAARGALAWQPSEVLPLRDGFGLHPSMPGLQGLFQQNRLAIVHGVGYPNANRSHFRSMDIWQSGVPDGFEVTGWLGRWHDQLGNDPLRMVHVGASVPRALVGAKGAAAAVPNGQIALPAALVPGFTEESNLAGDLGPWGARIAASAQDLLRVKERIAPILANGTTAQAGTSLEAGATATGDSRNELDDQLDVVVKLLAADVPTRVFSVALGGFDTHAVEKDTHARLMAALDGALTRFQAKLASVGKGDRVVTVVYSEFGRRLSPNLSNGTDHGEAAPVLVLGDAVHGGFHGAAPSLTALDQGDLVFTTDFRSIYAAVLASVLGTPASNVLAKAPAPLSALF